MLLVCFYWLSFVCLWLCCGRCLVCSEFLLSFTVWLLDAVGCLLLVWLLLLKLIVALFWLLWFCCDFCCMFDSFASFWLVWLLALCLLLLYVCLAGFAFTCWFAKDLVAFVILSCAYGGFDCVGCLREVTWLIVAVIVFCVIVVPCLVTVYCCLF